MSRRRGVRAASLLLVPVLLGTGLTGAGSAHVPSVPSATATSAVVERPRVDVRVTPVVSPNGDGVRDRAVVRYSLSRGDRPEVVIHRRNPDNAILRVPLGKRAPGTHRWTWDGRKTGRVVSGDLWATVVGRVHRPGGAQFVVDTAFVPTLEVRDGTRPAAVHPRSPASAMSRDTITLRASVGEATRDGRVRFRIRDRRGRVVLDRRVSLSEDRGREAELVWDARWRGRPLPRGRYSVELSGKDRHGNHGSTRMDAVTGDGATIWVSGDQLVEREESFDVAPWPDFSGAYCGIDGEGGNGCSDPEFQPCGTVTLSALFPGGLSHRSGECPEVARGNEVFAFSGHDLAFPDVVRVTGVRVAFTGSPTVAGEPDVGTLAVGSERVTSGTGGRTEWVTDTPYQDGHWSSRYDEQTLPPTAYWSFSTRGTDAVDVASFRVDVRYLVKR